MIEKTIAIVFKVLWLFCMVFIVVFNLLLFIFFYKVSNDSYLLFR
jgi:hypothetical protein